jgi:hypothetical protein
MITVHELFTSKNYKYNHILLDVLHKGEAGEVLVFVATYENIQYQDRFSLGVIEANHTIWNPESPQRPDGYMIIHTIDREDGVAMCIFVEREWYFYSLTEEEQDSIPLICEKHYKSDEPLSLIDSSKGAGHKELTRYWHNKLVLENDMSTQQRILINEFGISPSWELGSIKTSSKTTLVMYQPD